EGLPGTGAHCAGEPGERAQAQWSAQRAGAAGAAGGESAIDGGGRWEGIFFFRNVVPCGTGDDREGAGGDSGKSTPAGGRTHDRIDSGSRRTIGSTDSAGKEGQPWIGQLRISQSSISQLRINAFVPYAL